MDEIKQIVRYVELINIINEPRTLAYKQCTKYWYMQINPRYELIKRFTPPYLPGYLPPPLGQTYSTL
jgi:hypothetical protein